MLLATQKIQSGGVIISKRPLNYSDLDRWNRTVTCYSGILAYRFMFLDVISTHLRLEYEFLNKSRLSLEKSADFSASELLNKRLFDTKTTLLRNEITNKTLLNNFLSITDFYVDVKRKTRGVNSVSNFDDVNDHLFWTILESETVHLMYERKPHRYSEWDQLLGPITQSKYDKMQFQFHCLKRKLIYNKKILTVILVNEKCPIGYSGKAPDCYDIDRSKDSQFYLT